MTEPLGNAPGARHTAGWRLVLRQGFGSIELYGALPIMVLMTKVRPLGLQPGPKGNWMKNTKRALWWLRRNHHPESALAASKAELGTQGLSPLSYSLPSKRQDLSPAETNLLETNLSLETSSWFGEQPFE